MIVTIRRHRFTSERNTDNLHPVIYLEPYCKDNKFNGIVYDTRETSTHANKREK